MFTVISYYATTARIRYYGQMPTSVGKSTDGVWGTGIQSPVFGEDAFIDWRVLLETASNQPFNLSSRGERAHESLANMALDLESLYVFTKRWGFLAGGNDDQGRLLARVSDVQPFQAVLQAAWRGDSKALAELSRDVKARVDVGAKGIDIAVVDLRNLICLMFLRDYHAGKTKVCGKPDCHSPYFLQQRRGQKYCTHKCAVLMNVRRFRERQARQKSLIRRKANHDLQTRM